MHADAEDEDEETSDLVPKCTSLIPLSPEEEKKAIAVLMRADAQRSRRQQAAYVSALHNSAFEPLA